MANSNGWGDGAANNSIGWGQGANNAISWGDSHAKSWAGATDIVGLTTDPDAQAFITAAAITDPTQQTAIDTLVKGMKADGLWTKMKAIYPFVGGTASAHKWNLKDPRDLDAAFRLVFNGGWTHSANGATPNGTNGYADTKLVPSTTITRNDGSFGMYFNTTRLASNTAQGAYSTANASIIGMYPRYTGNIFYSYINTQNGVASSTAATNTLGFRAISRTSSTNNIIQYNNNQNNATQASQGDLPLNLYIGALNLNGTATDFDSIRICFTYLSTSLSSSELSNLYTRVQAFQTALSRQV